MTCPGEYPSVEAAIDGLTARLAVHESLAARSREKAGEIERQYKARFGQRRRGWGGEVPPFGVVCGAGLNQSRAVLDQAELVRCAPIYR